ncbi:hypothetical protein BD413DRAFT_133860 [Trametes elegans]|nr:hypothetical protein BD413DRAFT_133860 [Trametes elegans]
MYLRPGSDKAPAACPHRATDISTQRHLYEPHHLRDPPARVRNLRTPPTIGRRTVGAAACRARTSWHPRAPFEIRARPRRRSPARSLRGAVRPSGKPRASAAASGSRPIDSVHAPVHPVHTRSIHPSSVLLARRPSGPHSTLPPSADSPGDTPKPGARASLVPCRDNCCRQVRPGTSCIPPTEPLLP